MLYKELRYYLRVRTQTSELEHNRADKEQHKPSSRKIRLSNNVIINFYTIHLTRRPSCFRYS